MTQFPLANAYAIGVEKPIVVLNSTFHGKARAESHQRWSTGMLYDNCRAPEGGIDNTLASAFAQVRQQRRQHRPAAGGVDDEVGGEPVQSRTGRHEPVQPAGRHHTAGQQILFGPHEAVGPGEHRPRARAAGEDDGAARDHLADDLGHGRRQATDAIARTRG